MNESRESKNAEQLEELLLLTEEIQEELEQKDQLIVELKTQLNESLTANFASPVCVFRLNRCEHIASPVYGYRSSV